MAGKKKKRLHKTAPTTKSRIRFQLRNTFSFKVDCHFNIGWIKCAKLSWCNGNPSDILHFSPGRPKMRCIISPTLRSTISVNHVHYRCKHTRTECSIWLINIILQFSFSLNYVNRHCSQRKQNLRGAGDDSQGEKMIEIRNLPVVSNSLSLIGCETQSQRPIVRPSTGGKRNVIWSHDLWHE